MSLNNSYITTDKFYMIGGIKIPVVKPASFELVLTWKNGQEISWPAASRHDAIQQHHKISLRTDLMQRLEVRSEDKTCDGEALWDADWPAASRNEILEMYGLV